MSTLVNTIEEALQIGSKHWNSKGWNTQGRQLVGMEFEEGWLVGLEKGESISVSTDEHVLVIGRDGSVVEEVLNLPPQRVIERYRASRRRKAL